MSVLINRRSLFRGAGAAGALALAGGAQAKAIEPPARAYGNGFAPAAGVAQLSRNENPYGPGPAALRAIADAASCGCYYSHGGEARLAAMIAERHGLTPEQVMMGAGSSEVLNCAAISLPGEGHILAPELFFQEAVNWADEKGRQVVRLPLSADMQIDLDAMAAAVTPETRLVYIVNPNNPTGLMLSGPTLRAFQAKLPKDVTLLVDEAYMELTPDPARDSVVDLVRQGENVVVARTFSKIHGLAGMRVGYAMARPDLLAKMKPWAMNFGGNTAGIAAATASYQDEAFLAESKARIIEARGMIEEAVKRAGLKALPSSANFVFVEVPDAERLRAAMEGRKILIRPPYGRFKTWSRVSTGRIEDVQAYVAALPELVRG